jgi:quinol monooxygenase YgiN
MIIIIKRTLNDYDSWKTLVSENNETRQAMGSRGVTIHRSKQNPNDVYLIFDWDDGKSYLDYFNLPAVQRSLADSGTTEVIEVSESFSLKA